MGRFSNCILRKWIDSAWENGEIFQLYLEKLDSFLNCILRKWIACCISKGFLKIGSPAFRISLTFEATEWPSKSRWLVEGDRALERDLSNLRGITGELMVFLNFFWFKLLGSHCSLERVIDLIGCFLEYWNVGMFFLKWLSINTWAKLWNWDSTFFFSRSRCVQSLKMLQGNPQPSSSESPLTV